MFLPGIGQPLEIEGKHRWEDDMIREAYKQQSIVAIIYCSKLVSSEWNIYIYIMYTHNMHVYFEVG